MSNDTMHDITNGQPTGTAGVAHDAVRETAQVAGEQGHAVAGAAADQARELTREARDQLATVTGEARDQAQRALSSTTDELSSQLEERLGVATDLARTRSRELRALAEGRPEEAGSTRDLALKASERLESMADRADDLGVRGVVEEVSDFARRRPLLFLAGAAGAGLLVGRLARATKEAGSSPSMGSMRSAPSTATAPTTPLGTPRPLGDTAPTRSGSRPRSAPIRPRPVAPSPVPRARRSRRRPCRHRARWAPVPQEGRSDGGAADARQRTGPGAQPRGAGRRHDPGRLDPAPQGGRAGP